MSPPPMPRSSPAKVRPRPDLDFTFLPWPVSPLERAFVVTPPRLSRTVAVLLALVVGASACRIRDRDEPASEEETLSAAEQEIVDDSADLDETTLDGSAIAAIPTLPLILEKGPVTLARAVERQQLGARLFLPVGCAQATAEGNVVTYEFDGCTGSYGLVALSGRQVVTFRPGPTEGSTSIEMRSEDLTLNGRPVDHQADVTLTFLGEQKRVDWSGSFTTTSRRGLPVEHTADLQLVLDEATRCSTLDGTTSGSVGGRGLDVVYTGLEACAPRGTCLAGRIDATARLRQLTIGLEFDGSATAVVTTPRGAEIDVALACTPRGAQPLGGGT